MMDSMPNWLERLLGERFFSPCAAHEAARKNEKNVLCLDCCSAFCHHCLAPHRGHRVLQIRRYMYLDVVRIDDLEKLIDSSSVQSYRNNGARVVFLNARAQLPTIRPVRAAASCRNCDRALPDRHLYCSLSCKVKCLVDSAGGLAPHLRRCDFLPFPATLDLDDGQLSPDSVVNSPGAPSSSGGSSSSGGGGGGGLDFVVRKKRSAAASEARASDRPPAGSPPPNRRKQENPKRSFLF